VSRLDEPRYKGILKAIGAMKVVDDTSIEEAHGGGRPGVPTARVAAVFKCSQIEVLGEADVEAERELEQLVPLQTVESSCVLTTPPPS
jgi:electron transfer flavoprotein alpha/beta subunit